jgi:hypothetical protein
MGWRLAGRLDADRQAALDAHLAGCDACAGRLRGQAAVDSALSEARVASAPPDLKGRVLALIADEPPAPPRQAPVRPARWLLAGLAAAFLLPVWIAIAMMTGGWLGGPVLRAFGRTDVDGTPGRLLEVSGTLATATLTVERWLVLGLVRGALLAGLVALVVGILVWATLLRRWSRSTGGGRPA